MASEQYTHEHLDHEQHTCGPDCALHGEQAQAFVDDLFADHKPIDQATYKQPNETAQTPQATEVKQTQNSHESHESESHKCGPDCALHGEQARAFVDDLFTDNEPDKSKLINQNEQTSQQMPESKEAKQEAPAETMVNEPEHKDPAIEDKQPKMPTQERTVQNLQENSLRIRDAVELPNETLKQTQRNSSPITTEAVQIIERQIHENKSNFVPEIENTMKVSNETITQVATNTNPEQFEEAIQATVTNEASTERVVEAAEATILEVGLPRDFTELLPVDFSIPSKEPVGQEHLPELFNEAVLPIYLTEAETDIEAFHETTYDEIPLLAEIDVIDTFNESKSLVSENPQQHLQERPNELSAIDVALQIPEETAFIDLPRNLEHLIVELEATEQKNVDIFLKLVEASGLQLDKVSMERLQSAYLAGDKETLRELLKGYWLLKNQDYLQEFIQTQQFVLPSSVDEDIYTRVLSLLKRLRNVTV